MSVERRCSFQSFGLALMGGVIVLLGVWLAQTAWRYAVVFDASRATPGLRTLMMRRKSNDLEQLLDALVRGRYDQVLPAVDRIDSYSAAIDEYLDTDMYRRLGSAYGDSLADLRLAAVREDWDGAREAALRLERGCIECHALLRSAR
jgi:hypothetical protein